MIRLQNVTKTYHLNGRRKTVADNITQVFPSGASVALLGRNGAGKSSMLQMISGEMLPTSGKIFSTGSISWPVGFAGSFHPDLTGVQNTRFVARIYGLDTDEVIDFVSDFADLGDHFFLPFRTYSSGMRARLAFGVSMAIPFDTYLIDEVTAVGDANFRKKSNEVLHARLANSGAIVVSHSMPTLNEICDSGAVLENGHLTFYSDLDEAIAHHMRNMNQR
ncbi:ABC transporter ATP-binding protein [Paracoccus aurantiacus]|uniref:ABC transporter ATP-binding protein n=1 Tax=Paracoccus aurantiacus TaxID=2599412 RepID=A0A5C6RUS6_9RHOB|nr:ABC transporter ATP-binding protein [Paracoccus aurantiacus]TXB65689.1 ABC transporter ATP-binding protein [Paracoccus aurantiacus]